MVLKHVSFNTRKSNCKMYHKNGTDIVLHSQVEAVADAKVREM